MRLYQHISASTRFVDISPYNKLSSDGYQFRYLYRSNDADDFLIQLDSGPHPYDDQEYYWAQYDAITDKWGVYRNGKKDPIIIPDDAEVDDVAEVLRKMNSRLDKRMMYN